MFNSQTHVVIVVLIMVKIEGFLNFGGVARATVDHVTDVSRYR